MNQRQNPPSQQTLKKYGWSAEDWNKAYEDQDGLCRICGQERKLVIDHRHVQGFKHMKPEKKKKYVRGLICVYCNRFVATKQLTLQRVFGLMSYLLEFELQLAKYEREE